MIVHTALNFQRFDMEHTGQGLVHSKLTVRLRHAWIAWFGRRDYACAALAN